MTVSDQRTVASPSPAESGLVFPLGFVWGAATASYQIEGAVNADGRGRSIWDTFSSTPGMTRNGDTGEIAADHYRRYEQDVALMAGLGLGAYRFSVSWPRVQPNGAGAANEAGLDFYRRLVDKLVEAEITPVLTLYHWDLPEALEDAGGWPARDTAYRFADYAAMVHAVLGDRVRLWTTLNEPWCAAFLGYCSGRHAPGRQEPEASLGAAHHLMLGHGLALQAMRANAAPDHEFSITLNLDPVLSHSTSGADQDAARRVDALYNRIFLDAMLRGHYPDDLIEDTRSLTNWSFVADGDLALIAAPIDLLGVNYYRPFRVAAVGKDLERPFRVAASPASERPGQDPSAVWRPAGPSPYPGCDGIIEVVRPPAPLTDGGWEIYPTGLRDHLVWLHREYPSIPIAITENGAAFHDVRGPVGRIHDRHRIDFLARHIAAAHDAITAGVDLRGYFVWSLLDNFEWAEGYAHRFGIVYVDFETGERTLKDSAFWYRDVIARNGLLLDRDGDT